ncbi:MAG: hypothetical protein A3F33_00100 [Candidatus Woykebacteria bacterium RIFCSPHIGHO2_12_FULL_43_10]|uniref:Rhodanese domain-containing protein n=2 Tax=Candidatus Woykeibacteriota TaxID=1817899 RepID=A0A1G1WVQ5_9BACT|nr:MAG: hypothetical protein A2802_01730 [Candidatus Woykebacteria bacterium RIFCSPHIGHO2_01_FULL_43_29]OGY29685.1 MAG: hypothetical protein A3J50_04460 [Candidatus Woykebacteria bacterium RIFCSPHIGHO2_02_FULL_43_16b]OGY30397.1 MAG: hypothetical protein A3F33_00100 [Candidatus Woykebacteria bacterium RIFCSPHIGHO2_12_FULL_43_10]OGY31846.1 MAG: hypothetical protein A3A61_02945 [Candidatus Woykebacteria bacterium RIFCSPLOWO2_01_FULL_43_14]
MSNFRLVLLTSIISIFVTSAILFASAGFSPVIPKRNFIKDFYATEVAVRVSPHTLRKKMDRGEENFVLVDVRSAEEYEKEHVVGAINIPAYKDANTSISLETEKEETDRIIKNFATLSKDKETIVYCYSSACMTGRKIGDLLARNGIYVKHLGIGWNEWRYDWKSWNHDGEWDSTKVEDYVVSGKEAGKPKQIEAPSPCGNGELSC